MFGSRRRPSREDEAQARATWEATPRALVEGTDYTLDPETGGMVFTSAYLLKRGFCCDYGCRNCPYRDE